METNPELNLLKPLLPSKHYIQHVVIKNKPYKAGFAGNSLLEPYTLNPKP